MISVRLWEDLALGEREKLPPSTTPASYNAYTRAIQTCLASADNLRHVAGMEWAARDCAARIAALRDFHG